MSVNGQFAAVLVQWAGYALTLFMLSMRSWSRKIQSEMIGESRYLRMITELITFKLMFLESSRVSPVLHPSLVVSTHCDDHLSCEVRMSGLTDAGPVPGGRLIDANNITEQRSDSQHSAYFAHQRSRLFSRQWWCLANVYCSKGWDPVWDFVKTDHGSQC